jgi:hypothetical protein
MYTNVKLLVTRDTEKSIAGIIVSFIDRVLMNDSFSKATSAPVLSDRFM